MLAEFITKLRELSDEAAKLDIHKRDDLPDALLYMGKDGELQEIPVPPPLPHHRVSTLKSFVDLYETEAGRAGGEALLFINLGAIEAHFGGKGRHWVNLHLEHTHRVQELCRLETPRAFTIPDAIRYIRMYMDGTGLEDLLTPLGKVNFSRRSDGTMVVDHGKESLGRAVENSIQGREEIPKSVVACVPAFAVPGLRHIKLTAKVNIFLDVDSEQIVFQADADDLAQGIKAALGAVEEALLDAQSYECRVYLGEPNWAEQ